MGVSHLKGGVIFSGVSVDLDSGMRSCFQVF